jgi:hypothetical protein
MLLGRIVAGTVLLLGLQETRDLPKGQIPDLGRPTAKGDEVPDFDYDMYFPGTWTFEWRVPESPLGPAGTIEGTETFAPGEDGRFYQSRIEAAGPGGEFTVESVIAYEKGAKTFARLRKDSRGYDILETGPVGGDLGGFYTIHYESAPFEANGHTVRLHMKTRLVSPVHYKVEARISVDGGPFTSFGNPWWQKVLR